MIESYEPEYWEDAAYLIAKTFGYKLPLNHIINSVGPRSLIPYAELCRSTMQILMATYEKESEFKSNDKMLNSYLSCYRLMFESGMTCLWELYAVEKKWATYLIPIGEIVELIITKNADYGPTNIWTFKHMGLVVRMNDKVSRLEHLAAIGRDAHHESVEDTCRDLVGYSIIGGMLAQDLFMLPPKGR